MTRRRTADRRLRRRIAPIIFVPIALALWFYSVPTIYAELRAHFASHTRCDSSLQALSAGTWVHLSGCGVDMFHTSFLVDSSGNRTHYLTPLRERAGSTNEPSPVALATAIESMMTGEAVRYELPTNVHTEMFGLRDVTAVVMGRMDRIDGKQLTLPQISPGLAADALVLEARERPEIQPAVTLFASGAVTLAFAVVLFRNQPRVRWWLVLLLALLGLVAGARKLQDYFDPIRDIPNRSH